MNDYVITGPGIPEPIFVKAPSRIEAPIAAHFTVWTKEEWDETQKIIDTLPF